MQRRFAFWIVLRSSLWFVPTLVVIVSMALAHGLVEVGARVPELSQRELPSIFGFSPEGSRAMLSAIATAMITIAGVAFSITIVALSLASSQYSPRVLRQFMRDRASQWVLGAFVGAFAFCLTVLPRVRSADENGFVPALAVAGGVIYALVGVGCLIFFIHHVATSIQASSIVAAIAAETRASANDLFPDKIDADEEELPVALDAGSWHRITAAESGYIQLVQEADLLRIAAEHDVIVRMEHGVGEFVVAGTPLVSVGGNGVDERALTDGLRAVFTITRMRTIEQDVMFGVRQIVDVALRALSPSLNDPTTASLCVNYLTTILHQLAGRRMGKRHRRHAGKIRLVLCPPSFADLLALGYGEIRAHAGDQVLVLRGILRGLEILADIPRHPARRAVLAAEAKAVRELLARNTCDPAASDVCGQADRLIARLAEAISADDRPPVDSAPKRNH